MLRRRATRFSGNGVAGARELPGKGGYRRQRIAGVPVAQVASLAETRLRTGFIFPRCDSLTMHEANVEASWRITRIAGFFENLSGLGDVFGNAFPEKITFPELSAAA